MSHDQEEALSPHDEDRRLPARVASMAAKVTQLEAVIASLALRVDGFQSTMATKEQLEANSKLFTMQLAHQQETLGLKLTAFMTEIKQDLAPIQRGIYYAVGIILTAFLGGALSLVWIRPGG